MIRKRIVWKDGITGELILENNRFRLIGKKITFNTLKFLECFYQCKIKSIKEV